MGYGSLGFSMEKKSGSQSQKFYGKYRAKVTNNVDKDEKRGRIKVKCPKVYGPEDESPWCLPCVPYAGKDVGIVFMPKVGDFVWIEFEEGEPDKPIWVGSWWKAGEFPTEVSNSYGSKQVGQHHVIKTALGTIHINEKDKIMTISSKGDTKITTVGRLDLN